MYRGCARLLRSLGDTLTILSLALQGGYLEPRAQAEVQCHVGSDIAMGLW